MSKFKINQRVMCIWRTAHITPELVEGEIYTVKSLYCDGDFINLREVEGSYGAERFEAYDTQEVTMSKSKGIKFDQGKPPISLVPVCAILGEAAVFGFGAKKYGPHNYRLGMDHTRPLDAAVRHTLALLNGEDIDPESGLPHEDHARACLAMYKEMKRLGTGTDDRFNINKADEYIVGKTDRTGENAHVKEDRDKEYKPIKWNTDDE